MISLVTQLVFVAVNNPCTRQSVAQEFSLSIEPASKLITVIRPVAVSANVSTNVLQGQIQDGSWEGGTPLRNGVTDC